MNIRLEEKQIQSAFKNSRDINSIRYTPREMEIIGLVAKCFSNHAIANKLYIDIKTIESHLKRIFKKTPIPRWANKRLWLAVNYKKFLENGK